MRLIYHPWEKKLLLLHICRPMASKRVSSAWKNNIPPYEAYDENVVVFVQRR